MRKLGELGISGADARYRLKWLLDKGLKAYQAHVEAEWKRMKASGLSSMNINPRLGRLEEGVAAQLNAQQSRPISPKPDSDAGQEEKPQLSQPMSPSQSKLKYKRKGV